jgi:hypothetical protein
VLKYRTVANGSAQWLFNHPVVEQIGATLRDLGFTGSRQTYYYQSGQYRFTAKILKSPRNTRDDVKFTLEFYALHLDSDVTFWSQRVGRLFPMLSEFWWGLSTEVSSEPVCEELSLALPDFAWRALEALLETPGLPGTSLPMIWPRSFAGDLAAQTRRRPETVDQMIAKAQAIRELPRQDLLATIETDPVIRSRAMFEVLRRGLTGADLSDVVLGRMRRDPHPLIRGHAARIVGCLVPGEDSAEELRVAAREDEDLDVRWSAQYALVLRQKLGEVWLNGDGKEWWRRDALP